MSEFDKELEKQLASIREKITTKEAEIKALKQYEKSLEIAIQMKKKVTKTLSSEKTEKTQETPETNA